MAKKKVTHQSKDPKNQQDQKTLAMEDPSEKLQNLKSLNSLLLKETFERRQQVESLEQAKEALQTELTRSKMVKLSLDTELTRSCEEGLGLELEKGLFLVFVETQLREMGVGFDKERRERDVEIRVLKSELENERERSSWVCRERDLVMSDLDGQVKEANGLKERVIEMEKKERNFEGQILRLMRECEGLVEVKGEKERVIEAVKREKHLVERDLKEVEGVIEGILSENSEQKVKLDELEKAHGALDELVLTLREEVGMFVLELEKSCGEAIKREKEMELQINALEEEKREKQRSIERLEEEKNSVEISAMEMKDRVVDLHKEVVESMDAVIALQEKCKGEKEKNKDLVSEISHYKDAFERVTLERDGAQKCFDEEKQNGMELMSKVSEMEKKIEESVEDLVRMRNENEKVVGEKKDLESQVKLLIGEKDNVQKNFLEAKRGVDDLRAKMESFGINSERALTMLKNTAALVCQSKEGSDGKEQVFANERKLEDEIEPYAAALEAIKNSFTKKEATMEDMKKQVESMKNTVAEAQKKKSFWTAVTSATIFAVASVAYVARAH